MPFQQLFQAASAGQIPPDAWVRFGPQDWIPVTAMPQLAGFFQRAPVPTGGTHVTRRGGGSSSVNISASDVIGHHPQTAPVQPAAPRGPAVVPHVTPVAVPGSIPIPTGRPVSPVRPVVSSPPVVAVTPIVTRSAKTATPAPPASQTAHPPRGKKKNSPLLPLILMGGAVAGLLLVMLVVFLMGGGSKKKASDDNIVAANEGPNDEIPAADSDVEISPPLPPSPSEPRETPVALSAETKGTSSNQTPTPPVSTSGKAASSASVALFTQHTNWRDPRRALKNKLMRLEVVQAWFAMDAKGGRLPSDSKQTLPAAAATEPQVGEESNESSDVSESIEKVDGAVPKYVFVQIKITNPGTTPLSYRSWNGPQSESTGMLAGADGVPVALISAEETVGIQRGSGTVIIAPQQDFLDTIIFEAPAAENTALKLLLPQSALPLLGPGYIGYEITSEFLGSGTTTTTAPPATAGGSNPVMEPNSTGRIPIPGLTDGVTALPTEPPPAAPDKNMPAENGEPAAVPAGEKMPEPVPEKPKSPAEPPSIKELDEMFKGGDAKEKPDDKASADQPEGEKAVAP